jgi:4-hydroxy-tetrahydrodipicolinate reductase
VSGAAAPRRPIRTVLVGASGRMGSEIVRLLPDYPALQLVGAVASAASARAASLAGVEISDDLGAVLAVADAELVLDFSSATAAPSTLHACAAHGTPLLLGTTGLAATLEPQLAAAAARMALLIAPNTSLGVAVLLELVRQAAATLPAEFDIEILEAHHRAKRDAPSGTALALGAAAAGARGGNLQEHAVYTREGASTERGAQQIGFAVLRGGNVVGEHEVRFLGEGEQLSLGHCASDRAVFARGALSAGLWLAGQSPGRYAMKDVLFR